MRVYEETSLGDIIDETFGPAEFEIDRKLFHWDADAVMKRGTALVFGGESSAFPTGTGREFSWVPMIWDIYDDDE